MSSLAVGGMTFLCIFGGALLGLHLRTRLREHHLGEDTKDLVKVGVGLIATMTALVLGLLVASTKSSFDTQTSELAQMSANIILLDRALAHYGPETKEVRQRLRKSVEDLVERLWATDGASHIQATSASEAIFDEIQVLTPKTDAQRALQSQATVLAVNLGQARWLLFSQKTSTVSPPFLTVVIFWLTITFTSFGLYSPRNIVVFLTMFVCALSVSAALFLVLELDNPFEGLVQISSESMRNALKQLGA